MCKALLYAKKEQYVINAINNLTEISIRTIYSMQYCNRLI